ncbi:cytochrome P450 [Thelephora ganbajun]|uniref:Cytochrome P450 n=1 Tax=Thelephora ganbajun TaxID=370292 RepID=A0ACB6ZHM1_THEGA|nr:cytochrome P450 [Thelephora ganbajun]
MLDDSKILSHLVVPAGVTISLIALTRYLKSRDSLNKVKFPYPPGPKGLPLIGNALDLPRSIPIWEGFAQMAETYGTSTTDIMYLKMFGTDVVVLNSSETIADLLDKRSAIYSDKMENPSRLFHEFFNIATVDRYDEGQRRAASRLLKNLGEHPADFHHHVQLATGSLALSITYGIRVDSPKNPYFNAVEEMLETILPALVPGAFLVEFLPFLRHFPSWLPGGGASSFGERVYKYSLDSITLPMQYVTERLKAGGEISGSLVTRCLDKLGVLREQNVNEEVIRNVAGLVYLAMADTTNTVLNTFFLAMARNTHILDEVTGGERLPEHSDMNELPYVTAIIKETFRWSPPVPIGTTHRLMEDDVYKGIFIPAGTTLLENIWGICHDEKVYPDPELFNPGRFLGKDGKIDPSVKDPEARIFGSGRRICPGRHFALRNLHLVIANVLTAFDILPPVDENGNPQPPPPAFKYSQVRLQQELGFLPGS